MKFRILAAAIAGVVLLAVSAFSQTATLEGNVKGFDGKPLAGAVIKIVRTDIKMNYQTKTDKKGHYIYMGLAPGSPVMVSVEIDGKQVDSAQGKATISDPKPIDFDLQKSKASQDQVRGQRRAHASTEGFARMFGFVHVGESLWRVGCSFRRRGNADHR